GHCSIVDSKDGIMSEKIMRSAAISYGGISWYAGVPIKGKDIKDFGILNTISLAWKLGKGVYESRKKNESPLDNILDITNGYLGFKGKVVDIIREFGSEKNKGFSSGTIIMDGIDEFYGSQAHIKFQNEWLILYVDDAPKCITPDLISIVDIETGKAIRTDIIKYGYRGNVIIIPSSNHLRTKKGIKTFGPRHFGYDVSYNPVEELQTHSK